MFLSITSTTCLKSREACIAIFGSFVGHYRSIAKAMRRNVLQPYLHIAAKAKETVMRKGMLMIGLIFIANAL